jgi:tripartite-type tricarboxylate transporter receptor subunit TctC
MIRMRSVFRVAIFLFIAAAALAIRSADAQDYPTRPVKLITQGAAGSGPDVVARIVFDQLGRLWGQQVVVINAPGAGGSAAARQAASAPADGYALYMPAASAFIVMSEMFPTLPFDITRDFACIGFVAEQPFVIAVSPSLGTNSLAEFIALSKQKAGEINYAANSRGTLPHLTAERFRAATGADLTFIRGGGWNAGCGGRPGVDDRRRFGHANGWHSERHAQAASGDVTAAAAEFSGPAHGS